MLAKISVKEAKQEMQERGYFHVNFTSPLSPVRVSGSFDEVVFQVSPTQAVLFRNDHAQVCLRDIQGVWREANRYSTTYIFSCRGNEGNLTGSVIYRVQCGKVVAA